MRPSFRPSSLPTRRRTALLLSLALALPLPAALAQAIETGKDRVVTSLDIKLPLLGVLKPRSTAEISGSNWLLGCETLDRDFADYEQYKDYLQPLGIHRLRMQAGWSKTEKVRGQYDFAWLDRIVDDATRRGLKPWLQTSYGNALYPGGGGANLGAGMPTSAEALAAWDRWVEALVLRYRDKVSDWEVWNEPNFGDNTMNTPEQVAEFNVRTARIIKRLQPQARISGLALGHIGLPFAEAFFKRIDELKAWGLFDNMTYHDYVYNPDANRHEVEQLRAALRRYTATVKLRQGENGAPSAGGSGRGALWDYPWTELTQAKWNTRRMLSDLGHDTESSVFGIVEMAYTHGPINRMNFKGLLKSDASKRVVRPKIAYYAVQNVVTLFDDRLQRLTGLAYTHNLADGGDAAHRYKYSTDRKLAVYGYRHRSSGKQAYTVWLQDGIPADANPVSLQQFDIKNADIDQPVLVDVITGNVYEVPAANVSRKDRVTTFKDIPVYDAPVVLLDRSLIELIK